MLALIWILAACDTKGGGTGDDTSTACDETNESCTPGTCGGEGSQMLPGSDCLACHSSGAAAKEEGEDEAPTFSVGGTAFSDLAGSAPLEGATIRVTDSTGTVATLTTNAAGNFYSGQTLTPPLSAEIEVDGTVRSMSAPVETGGCNSCHACAGAAGGKLTGP